MSTIKIFKLDGTLQCGMGEEHTLDDMRNQLQSIGGDISDAKKERVPYMIPTVCGAPTGYANVFTITNESWERIKIGIVGTLGFAVWVFDTPTTLVYKYDGTLQCNMGHEIKLIDMAKELEAKEITVHNQYKATDGNIHISMCGASTGAINVFEIDSSSLEQAKNLGFSMLMNVKILADMTEQSINTDPFINANSTLGGTDDTDAWPWPW